MNPIRTTTRVLGAPGGELPAAASALTAMSKNSDFPHFNGVTKMHLIQEALSRARMRWPQADQSTPRTEATRSARVIAMQARQRAAREAGIR